MAFWRSTSDANGSSSIGALIDAYNESTLSISTILDHSEILQETRCENSKLISFLRRPEVLNLLLEHAINADAYEKESYVACEILTSGKPDIHSVLVQRNDCLERLLSILDRTSPLNGLSVSYFSRILEDLASKQPEALFDFLKTDLNSFMNKILSHFDCTAIVEMLAKILRMSSDSAFAFSKSLDDIGFIQKVVSLLETDRPFYHSNASLFLTELIKPLNTLHSDSQEPSEVANVLRSRIRSIQNINFLFSVVFHENASESTLKHGLQILIAIADSLLPSAYVSTSLANISFSLSNHAGDAYYPDTNIREIFISGCLTNFPRLSELLFDFMNYPVPVSVNQTATYLPFSESRLHIVFLISRLVAFDSHDLSVYVDKLLPDLFLECFRRFPFNSYLHSTLCRIMRLLLNKPTLPGCLPQIVSNIAEVYEDLPQNSPCRGHLIEFMNLLVPHGQGEVWERFIEEQRARDTLIERLRSLHPSNTGANFDTLQVAQLLSADEYPELRRHNDLVFKHSDELFIKSMAIPSPPPSQSSEDEIDQRPMHECEVSVVHDKDAQIVALSLTGCSSIAPTTASDHDNFNAHWADFPSLDGWLPPKDIEMSTFEPLIFSSTSLSIVEDEISKAIGTANLVSACNPEDINQISDIASLTNGEDWDGTEHKDDECEKS